MAIMHSFLASEHKKAALTAGPDTTDGMDVTACRLPNIYVIP